LQNLNTLNEISVFMHISSFLTRPAVKLLSMLRSGRNYTTMGRFPVASIYKTDQFMSLIITFKLTIDRDKQTAICGFRRTNSHLIDYKSGQEKICVRWAHATFIVFFCRRPKNILPYGSFVAFYMCLISITNLTKFKPGNIFNYAVT
jgi:hypothetical protein